MMLLAEVACVNAGRDANVEVVITKDNARRPARSLIGELRSILFEEEKRCESNLERRCIPSNGWNTRQRGPAGCGNNNTVVNGSAQARG
jgi:hypothetical protein